MAKQSRAHSHIPGIGLDAFGEAGFWDYSGGSAWRIVPTPAGFEIVAKGKDGCLYIWAKDVGFQLFEDDFSAWVREERGEIFELKGEE